MTTRIVLAPNGARLGRVDIDDDLFAYKAEDQESYSSTLQNDSDLYFDVEEDGVYEFFAFLIFDTGTSSSAGFQFYWDVPSGTTIHSASDINSFFLETGGATGVAANTTECLPLQGVMIVGDAGTLRLQWAQISADSEPTTLHRGSWVRARKRN